MLAEKKCDLLGIGLYTPAEAARYARIHTDMMKRWIHGDKRGEPVVTAQLKGDEQRTVTFLDMVQAMAIRAIRQQYDVPLQKIRAAVDHVQQTRAWNYPLARKHRTFVIEFNREIVIQVGEESDDLVQVSGSHRDQKVMREIVEPYLRHIDFGEDDLACAYTPVTALGRNIVMDPSRRFGQPLVGDCGYTAEALLNALRTERSVPAASMALGVEPDDIRAAVEFDDFLQGKDAA